MILALLLLALPLHSQPATFESLLKQIAPAPPESCEDKTAEFLRFEPEIFQAAGQAVLQGLNRSNGTPHIRALEALKNQIVSAIPPFVFAGGLAVNRIGGTKEKVDLGEDVHIEVELRGDRWLLTFFRLGVIGRDPLLDWKPNFQ